MSKEVAFQHRDKFLQLGVAIAALRKLKGMSQEMLADKAGISRGLLSTIESPNTVKAFSLEVLYNIADALEMDAVDLLNYANFSDQLKVQK